MRENSNERMLVKTPTSALILEAKKMKPPTYTDMLKRRVIWIDVSERVVKEL